MMRRAQKMPHQRARRPWEGDEDCHSLQTYRRVRIGHRHKQEMSISPHTLETLVHRHVFYRDLLCHALTTIIFAGHEE